MRLVKCSRGSVIQHVAICCHNTLVVDDNDEIPTKYGGTEDLCTEVGDLRKQQRE